MKKYKFTKRNTLITKKLLRKKPLFIVHSGKIETSIQIKPKYNMIGHHIGEYVITKKLGASIHDSEKNKKKKNKKKK